MAARSCLRSDDKAPTLARNNTTQTSDAYCNCNCTLSCYVLSFNYTLSDNNFTQTHSKLLFSQLGFVGFLCFGKA